uniref:DUF4058 family protein n=1 Tax=Cyanothece sp. (strain PCC 7425 / ATCC 29141) TaxID=395961 RepID=B8HTC7_CYAP4
MPSPFPGMDPYLEQSGLWQEFHNRLMVAIADVLGPQLRPKYRVAIEKRVYEDASEELALIGRPDVTVVQPLPEVEPVPAAIGGTALIEPVVVEVPMPEEFRELICLISPIQFLYFPCPSKLRMGNPLSICRFCSIRFTIGLATI